MKRWLMLLLIYSLWIPGTAAAEPETTAMPTASLVSAGGGYVAEICLMLALALVCVGFAVILFLRLRRAHRTLVQLAFYDDLLGCPNLKKFLIDSKELLTRQKGRSFVLMVLDIRNFRTYNDFHGFDAGNRLLFDLRDGLRRHLNPQTELFARVVADEFILLLSLPKGRNPETLLSRAQTLPELLLPPSELTEESKLYCNQGIYLIEPGESIEEAYEKVNLAHKLAKKHESNSCFLYDEAMKLQVQSELVIESTMEEALQNGEFQVYIQPQYDTETETIAGGEALVRWRLSDGNFMVPSVFLHVFEQNRFIMQLDYFMFEESCRILRGWIQAGLEIRPISVNFSRLHLENPRFVKELCAMADRYAVPRRFLGIELTETTIMEHEARLIEVIREFHTEGFTLSMDDFGSGYSSLGILKSLPVDCIKLDKSLFSEDGGERRLKIIVESIIRMAKQLGNKTVAEGIEEESQVDFLRSIGCDLIQGYYFGKPMPVLEFTALLKQSDAGWGR